MKIVLNEGSEHDELEIVINCVTADDTVHKIMAMLKSFEKKLIGLKDNKAYVIELSEVLYIDTADKKAFIYTEDNIFDSDLKLYELEAFLKPYHFFRSSKSAIINIAKIKAIEPSFGGRLEVTLRNNERLIVSRQYAHELKIVLGI